MLVDKPVSSDIDGSFESFDGEVVPIGSTVRININQVGKEFGVDIKMYVDPFDLDVIVNIYISSTFNNEIQSVHLRIRCWCWDISILG